MAKKRKVFHELMEGVAAMKTQRNGKITLRSYHVEPQVLPDVKPKMIKQVRERFGHRIAVARGQVSGHV